MKKIKTFLNKIEDLILFRYGKRSWQLLSIIAIGFFAFETGMYVYNARPSFRENVSITKIEFDRNEIDRDFDISNDIDQCSLKDYNQELQGLKKMMSESEWYKLGDTVTVRDYVYKEEYDYYWEQYYERKVYYDKREYRKNEDAIPNILESIYESKAIDSAQYCNKIKVLNLIQEFVKYTNNKKSAEILRRDFRDYIAYNGKLTPELVQKLIKLYKISNGSSISFSTPYEEGDDWSEFTNLLNIGRRDSLTEDRFDIAKTFVSKVKSRFTFKKGEDVKNDLARYVLGSNLEDDDLKKLTEDFLEDKEIKLTSSNLKETFNKYYHLYSEKVELAERILEKEKWEKEANREKYFENGSISFLSIIGIAAILILFSIRQIIKDKSNNSLDS